LIAQTVILNNAARISMEWPKQKQKMGKYSGKILLLSIFAAIIAQLAPAIAAEQTCYTGAGPFVDTNKSWKKLNSGETCRCPDGTAKVHIPDGDLVCFQGPGCTPGAVTATSFQCVGKSPAAEKPAALCGSLISTVTKKGGLKPPAFREAETLQCIEVMNKCPYTIDFRVRVSGINGTQQEVVLPGKTGRTCASDEVQSVSYVSMKKR
jgi:hypothetical protein